MNVNIQKFTARQLADAYVGNAVFHAAPGFFDNHDRESIQERLRRYNELQCAYEGEYYLNRLFPGGEEDSPYLNLCRKMVKKGAYWLMGKPWKLIEESGNEAMADAILEVWEDNRKDLLSYLIAHNGTLTGDGYIFVTLDDDEGRIPFEEAKIVITWIPSRYVHPVVDTFDRLTIRGVLIQYPVGIISDGEIVTTYNSSVDHLVESTQTAMYSQYITEKGVFEYLDQTLVKQRDNIFGEIPLFHCQNILTTKDWFGESDILDVWQLNRQIDRSLSSMQETTNYHSEPLTVITGGRASQLERGANKVWSIPSKDARVYTIQIDPEMSGAPKHYDRLKQAVAEVAETPLHSLESSNLAISNTTGTALQLMFLPLIEKTCGKHVTYGTMLKEVNAFLARLLIAQGKVRLSSLRRPRRFDKFEIDFTIPLPKNEEEILNNLEKKMNMSLESKVGAMRILGTRHIQRKIS